MSIFDDYICTPDGPEIPNPQWADIGVTIIQKCTDSSDVEKLLCH